MTAEDRNLINTFEAQVRSLLLKMDTMQKEADELCAMVDERDDQIKQLKNQLIDLQGKYDMLKTARILTLSDDDTHNAKVRLMNLIREVDICIAQVKAQE